MTARLRRVLLCPPSHAGWSDEKKASAWRDLGFLHAPNFDMAQSAHGQLCRHLTEAGAEVILLPPSPHLTLDAVYTHDASLPTNRGVVLMRAGKSNRVAESREHGEFLARQGVSTLAEIRPPGTSEAGDIVWLDERTLLVGRGLRSNAAGIDQLRSILAPHQVEVIKAPLPYSRGPVACLHLMSLMSMLDEETILVDLPWLAVETVETLRSRGFRLVEIDYSERETLACNVLALGGRRLVALEENAKTNARLSAAGFELKTFPGGELCINGAGGPTCLTRPLLRG
jgi:N-dimethylarginine dimethylaminohydrolase